jgi:hypothetical protein
VCTEVGQVEHDGKGGATASFGLLEYRPAKKKPAVKPKSKSSGANGGTPPGSPTAPDPNAAAKAQVESLLKEWQAP